MFALAHTAIVPPSAEIAGRTAFSSTSVVVFATVSRTNTRSTPPVVGPRLVARVPKTT
jgi:hypothetical protein